MKTFTACLVVVVAAGTPDAHSQPAPLPYDLAFAQRTFPCLEDPAVSPGGAFVAYSVMRPVVASRDARYQPNGTPSSAAGSTIDILSLSTPNATPQEICLPTYLGNAPKPSSPR